MASFRSELPINCSSESALAWAAIFSFASSFWFTESMIIQPETVEPLEKSTISFTLAIASSRSTSLGSLAS